LVAAGEQRGGQRQHEEIQDFHAVNLPEDGAVFNLCPLPMRGAGQTKAPGAV
jgi:hypothetical protein